MPRRRTATAQTEAHTTTETITDTKTAREIRAALLKDTAAELVKDGFVSIEGETVKVYLLHCKSDDGTNRSFVLNEFAPALCTAIIRADKAAKKNTAKVPDLSQLSIDDLEAELQRRKEEQAAADKAEIQGAVKAAMLVPDPEPSDAAAALSAAAKAEGQTTIDDEITREPTTE